MDGNERWDEHGIFPLCLLVGLKLVYRLYRDIECPILKKFEWVRVICHFPPWFLLFSLLLTILFALDRHRYIVLVRWPTLVVVRVLALCIVCCRYLPLLSALRHSSFMPGSLSFYSYQPKTIRLHHLSRLMADAGPVHIQIFFFNVT